MYLKRVFKSSMSESPNWDTEISLRIPNVCVGLVELATKKCAIICHSVPDWDGLRVGVPDHRVKVAAEVSDAVVLLVGHGLKRDERGC